MTLSPRTIDRIIVLATWWARIAWTVLALYAAIRIAELLLP